mmetsp:Transcript_35342/g.88843  ORF Transcript_35342/g.88843 Transcript_35342/m.88843 type:complete len:148 (+) Transcript_35342:151-594(+)
MCWGGDAHEPTACAPAPVVQHARCVQQHELYSAGRAWLIRAPCLPAAGRAQTRGGISARRGGWLGGWVSPCRMPPSAQEDIKGSKRFAPTTAQLRSAVLRRTLRLPELTVLGGGHLPRLTLAKRKKIVGQPNSQASQPVCVCVCVCV